MVIGFLLPVHSFRSFNVVLVIYLYIIYTRVYPTDPSQLAESPVALVHPASTQHGDVVSIRSSSYDSLSTTSVVVS